MTEIVVSSRALVVNERQELLLVKIKEGYWCLPGGLLEENESLMLCAEREVYEETGYRIDVTQLFYCYEFYDPRYDSHRVEHCFLADILEAPAAGNWEDLGEDKSVVEARFFTLDAIGKLEAVYPDIIRKGEWARASHVPDNIYLGMQR